MASDHQPPSLEVNSQSGEYFLRLPAPLEHIIITPPRASDAPAIHTILNDPRVYLMLASIPHPYTRDQADEWAAKMKDEADSFLREFAAICSGEPNRRFVSGCPFKMIREVRDDGEDVYLGEIDFVRCGYLGYEASEQARLTAENEAKPVGDPSIVWQIGYYLAPSHHGRGIMTSVVATLIHEWCMPIMGVRHLLCTAFTGNGGSKRVFEKNGFVLKEVQHDCLVVRGETRSQYVLEWKA